MSDDELFGHEHVKAYRETDGERGFIWRNGTTILLLTTKGKKSGEDRTMPLIFREDDGRYVIVASKGGWDHDPIWFQNMRANPDDVRIQVKADAFPVSFAVAEGEERSRLWSAMTAVWPDYDTYQQNTDREIPVVVLSRR